MGKESLLFGQYPVVLRLRWGGGGENGRLPVKSLWRGQKIYDNDIVIYYLQNGVKV